MKRTLRDRRVGVVGLAKSGVAAARLCAREGARIVGVDQRAEAELADAMALRDLGVELITGGHGGDVLRRCDLVVVSPGVPLCVAEVAAAARAGIPVVGEVELASWFLDAPLVGITGTNGKSTTTALAGHLFAASGRRVFVGGNLGRPLAEAVLDGARCDLYVVELSSFQLESAPSLRPAVAVVTNLTPDHLDRYPDLAAYGAAKRRIFAHQTSGDVAVVNADDAVVREMPRGLSPKVVTFGRAAAPDGGMRDAGAELVWGAERYRVGSPALRGAHNRENAMAAALAGRLAGAPPEAVQRGLDSYPGLPHRLESIRTVGGVEYVNDSKATNVDSTAVGLRAFDRGVWLIAGGRGKGAPYAPLVEAAVGRVEAVLTVGEDAPAIETACRGVVEVIPCGTLEVAVREARRRARGGDVVLLSPACASYDQFRNFEHRGAAFRAIVEALG